MKNSFQYPVNRLVGIVHETSDYVNSNNDCDTTSGNINDVKNKSHQKTQFNNDAVYTKNSSFSSQDSLGNKTRCSSETTTNDDAYSYQPLFRSQSSTAPTKSLISIKSAGSSQGGLLSTLYNLNNSHNIESVSTYKDIKISPLKSTSTSSSDHSLSLSPPSYQQYQITKEAKMLKIDDMIEQLKQFTPTIRHEIFSTALENEYIKLKANAFLLPFNHARTSSKLDVIIDRLETNMKVVLAREERRHLFMIERESRLRLQYDNESLRIQHQQEMDVKRIQFEQDLELKRLAHQLEKERNDKKFWAVFAAVLVAIIACFFPGIIQSAISSSRQ